jgi:hypothetical protein
MSEFLQILQSGAESLIEKIKANIQSTNTFATGKTSESLGYEIIDEGDKITLNITANEFAQVIETGRKPTPEKKPSFSMIQNITDWVNARGLESSLVWAIATQINNKGTQLWQKGGSDDIYTLPFNEFVELLAGKILDIESDEFTKLILKANGNQHN